MTEREKIILEDSGELERKVTDILYCRRLCNEIGINYNNPSPEDCMKARKYILERYEIKKKEVKNE